ncbi:hypothetical protein, partial [Phycicoccus flavus]|nr:hypothetical protein [Phycicoccus flavus]
MSVPTQPVVGPGTDDAGAYVRAVRLWLDDLPSEDADELTRGMEADLAERAAESGERLWPLLGEPEAYAAELRSAAGLPPRRLPDEPARPGHLAQFRADWLRLRDSALERWPWVRDLRAAWWLARGFTLLWVLGAMAGS